MERFILRCVQLDLARQMEPLPVIKEFIQMAAANGYNSVLLYLEDRIRTASYPYPAPNESYSKDEIREIVSFAEKCGIELIPCVATLGHAERFLRHKELFHLSEAQPGMKNKFGVDAARDVFCISQPGFYPFIRKYLIEVATLFPSQYFHIGLDEFFDFNLCDKCREAMPTLADEESAFLEHIHHIRACLLECGKQVMMWSDMLEIYTTVAALIPKDVIMVDWQYREDVRNYMGHLLDMDIEDRPQCNTDISLSTIIAPSDHHFANAQSMIHACEGKEVMGFLMTMWEKTDTYALRSYPEICYAGRISNGETPNDAWTHTVEYLFGTTDRTFANILKLAQFGPLCRHFAEVNSTTLFCRPFDGLPLERHESTRILLEMVKGMEKQITTELGHRVWLDTLNMLEEKVIQGDFKEACQDIIDFGVSSHRVAAADAIAKRFEALITRKQKQWELFRNGITPNIYDKRNPEVINTLRKNLEALKSSSLVKLRCALLDQYVVNFVKVDIQLKDGSWQNVTECSGFKADELTDSLFEYTFPTTCKGTPIAIKIECWGMGARGFAYAEVRNEQGRIFTPTAIISLDGIVEHPEFLLQNNGNVAWFGNQSTRHAYYNSNAAFMRHSVTLALK